MISCTSKFYNSAGQLHHSSFYTARSTIRVYVNHRHTSNFVTSLAPGETVCSRSRRQQQTLPGDSRGGFIAAHPFLVQVCDRVEFRSLKLQVFQHLCNSTQDATHTTPRNMSGGQRTQSSGGAAASVAAGCGVREIGHPRTSPRIHNDDGLAVFSWGRGEDGQLGLGDTRYVFCVDRTSTKNLTLETTVNGITYPPPTPPPSIWDSDQDEPTYVDALRGVGVRQIACGSGHTVVLTVDGEVYTWGRGDDGRLGHGDNGWKVRWSIFVTSTMQNDKNKSLTCAKVLP